jgi:hypothetical protein
LLKWCIGNCHWEDTAKTHQVLAHYQYAEDPVFRPVPLRMADDIVENGRIKPIDAVHYLGDNLPVDTTPYDHPKDFGTLLNTGTTRSPRQYDLYYIETNAIIPTRDDFIWEGEVRERPPPVMNDPPDVPPGNRRPPRELPEDQEIPVLPSAPPAEDTPMDTDDEEEPVSDEVWPFIKVQSSVDMSVGDGVYLKADGTEKFARGGMSAEYASSAETLFSDVPSVYGFVYGHGMLYGNTMPPGVMGTNRNMPNYNPDFAYYSRMVRPTTEKTRVGWFLTGNNATEVNIWMLPGNLELKNQERLKSFEGFGAFDMNDDYAMARFASWLYALPNYVKDTYPYRCTAFEVDPTDGSGYYNGFM